MKKRKFGLTMSFLLAAGTILGACGGGDNEAEKEGTTDTGEQTEETFKVAMVTDVGGIDDKSFNQSAWKGIQEFGEANGLEKGQDGYNYLQSQSDADYTTNLNSLARQDFDLIFGIGFMMQESINEIAGQQTEAHFGMVDAVVEKENVASILFKEQEASFLAGVAAGLTTESNKIGFIGGMQSDVIERFEAGFQAGVKAVNPDATIDVQYAEAFDKAEIGQSIASRMYSSGVDVVFHAAGATGNGLFKEARDLKAKDPSKNYWAIGVDSDQVAEGVVEIDGTEHNIILTSALKRVDVAVNDLSTKAKEGNFPGGETTVYGLAEDGVGLAEINDAVTVKADIETKVQEYSDKIKSGDLVVPGTLEELETFSAE
ncbi:nucleoside-binding protein [Mesobacillus persicus]|uniref:Nucleoside-binding protein n=1 Tax=Mesobacillus persicus TaxID=930146 RepID=A0A1H7YSB5_9BACI|nr:BMP family protein [Mesobacillus persicus]SEM48863.1 nucleoside-binding protein [Mesobacillus persicus]